MPDNINNQPSQNPTTIDGFCSNPLCKAPLSMPFPPMISVHHVVVDMLSIPHTQGVECPACGTYHNCAMVSFSINMAIIPETKPQLNEDSLIKPATVIPFTNNRTI